MATKAVERGAKQLTVVRLAVQEAMPIPINADLAREIAVNVIIKLYEKYTLLTNEEYKELSDAINEIHRRQFGGK